MNIQQNTFKFLSTTLVLALCLASEAWPQQQNGQPSQQPQQAPANQQSPTQNATDQAQQPASQTQGQQGNNQVQGTQVNPSQAPLAPVTTYPNANDQPQTEAPAQPQQPQTTTTVPQAPQPKTQQPSQPVGAATAEKVPTAGGAAAKPAGVAIAPAKQHQTRSLLIKVGAALAAGAAIGTVYALSRGTSSTPPGANSPGALPK